MLYSKAKMHQTPFQLGAGAPPQTPLGELRALIPQTLYCIKGVLL